MEINLPFNAQSVHCVGIGGVGVSAAARYCKYVGARVSGSDERAGDMTVRLRKEGIPVAIGHRAENVPRDTDLLIYSPAVTEDNPEYREAIRRGIPALSYPQMLGRIAAEYHTVAVAGTNGKTGTTALLGTMLEYSGRDPNVIVGGTVRAWGGNTRFGAGDVFVVEACEYKRGMLNIAPQTIILTNITEDHLDYYRDMEDIKDAFISFARRLGGDGTLIYNDDDMNARQVARESAARTISFGMNESSFVRAVNVRQEREGTRFGVLVGGTEYGELVTSLPGTYNVYNILAAVAAALDMGVPFDRLRAAVAEYCGTGRRFEEVGTYRGIPVISDYAHHPDAIRVTIEAARGRYPDGRILIVYQPHQRARTRLLFDDFVRALSVPEPVVLVEIYEVAGREIGEDTISSRDLVEAIARSSAGEARYAADLREAHGYIDRVLDSHGDISALVIMGAGNIDTLARELAKKQSTV